MAGSQAASYFSLIRMTSEIMKTYQHYINGAWVKPADSSYFDTDNPYTGEVWAQIAKGNSEDVARAVAAAKAAFETGPWTEMRPTTRGKLLVKLPRSLNAKPIASDSWRCVTMAS